MPIYLQNMEQMCLTYSRKSYQVLRSLCYIFCTCMTRQNMEKNVSRIILENPIKSQDQVIAFVICMTRQHLSMSLCLTSPREHSIYTYTYIIYDHLTNTTHQKCNAKMTSKTNSVLTTIALTTPDFKPQQKRQKQCVHHSTCLCVICQHNPKIQNTQKRVDLWGVAYIYIY